MRAQRLAIHLALGRPHRVLVVNVVVALHLDREQQGQARQCLAIVGRVRPARVVPGIQSIHLRVKNGGLQGIQPRVVADAPVIVGATTAVEAKLSHLRRHLLIVGGDHAPIARRAQVLRWEEAEAGGIAPRASSHALLRRTDRLRRILNHPQVVALGKRAQFRHRRELPVKVHRNDGARSRRNLRLHGSRIERESIGLDVGKHRRRARQADHLHRCHKGEGRRDHLVAGANPHRDQGKEQRIRAGGDSDRVFCSAIAGDASLQPRHPVAQDELRRLKYIEHRSVDLRLHPQVLGTKVGHGHVHYPRVHLSRHPSPRACVWPRGAVPKGISGISHPPMGSHKRS